MEVKQDRSLQRFRRAKGFLDRETLALGHGDAAVHAQTLGQVIGSLTANAVAQEQSVRETSAAVVRKSQVLRQLIDAYMRPLARIAGTLFPDDQTLLDALKMPRRGTAPLDMVAAARAMANAAEPHIARLTAIGFAADFPDRMRAAAQTVEETLGQVREQRALRAAATSGAADQVRRGQRITRSLDPAVRVALIGDAGKLAEWRSLVRLGRVPGVRTPGGTAVPATAEGATVSAPTVPLEVPLSSAETSGEEASPGAESSPTSPETGAA